VNEGEEVDDRQAEIEEEANSEIGRRLQQETS
jgi:hypothetical protein